MSVDTMLDIVVEEDGALLTGTWELDPARCAVEIGYAELGLTIWRARLRLVEARVTLAEDGTDGITWLSATLAARPAFASPPGSGCLFLRSVQREQTIRVTGDAVPHAGGVARTAAKVSVGDQLWWARLLVRLSPITDERAIVAAAGTISRSKDAPATHTPVRVELAAEFVRCG